MIQSLFFMPFFVDSVFNLLSRTICIYFISWNNVSNYYICSLFFSCPKNNCYEMYFLNGALYRLMYKNLYFSILTCFSFSDIFKYYVRFLRYCTVQIMFRGADKNEGSDILNHDLISHIGGCIDIPFNGPIQ